MALFPFFTKNLFPGEETEEASTLFITNCIPSLISHSFICILSSNKGDNIKLHFFLQLQKFQSHIQKLCSVIQKDFQGI